MAKDTEKLIRQLSLISFLMAERRPVSALEIKQDVEGYSQMNDEAFARRFYADRAELDSLGIHLKVDKPAEGYYEAENYSLPPENFYLPAIEFTDEELGAVGVEAPRERLVVHLRVALDVLLDLECGYGPPLRHQERDQRQLPDQLLGVLRHGTKISRKPAWRRPPARRPPLFAC